MGVAAGAALDGDNLGHQMLASMGWQGQGLGARGEGVVAPVSGGRPEEGKPTGEWLACLPAEGETIPPAARSAEAAATASAAQTAQWKAEAAGETPAGTVISGATGIGAAAAEPGEEADARGEKRKDADEPGRAQRALEKLAKAKRS